MNKKMLDIFCMNWNNELRSISTSPYMDAIAGEEIE